MFIHFFRVMLVYRRVKWLEVWDDGNIRTLKAVTFEACEAGFEVSEPKSGWDEHHYHMSLFIYLYIYIHLHICVHIYIYTLYLHIHIYI